MGGGMIYDIEVNWDKGARVWCAVCNSIPIVLECHSFDALIERVKVAAYEVLEMNGKIEKNLQLRFMAAHTESIA
jgi:hypothetical protein